MNSQTHHNRLPTKRDCVRQEPASANISDEEVKAFDDIKPLVDTRTLSNGEYVEAKITLDPDGIRTVHTLNVNVRTRHVYDYKESRAMMCEAA